jgi:hypothetical protein
MKQQKCYCGCGNRANAIGLKVKVPLYSKSCEQKIIKDNPQGIMAIEDKYWNSDK